MIHTGTGQTGLLQAARGKEIAPQAMQDLLQCLLGRDVTVRKPAAPPVQVKGMITGIYEADDGTVKALVSFDLSLAAHAAAALCLVPAACAKEAIAAKKLAGSLLENITEVLNVCAGLLNDQATVHLALRGVCEENSLPAKVDRGKAVNLGDFDVVVPGYGGGRLSVRGLE
jgi:hypothetical protein